MQYVMMLNELETISFPKVSDRPIGIGFGGKIKNDGYKLKLCRGKII